MNIKRFSARTSRDALNLVRQAFGEDAVVLSTRPCAEGVEVLAMAPESVQQAERVSAAPQAPQPQPPGAPLMPVMRRPPVPKAQPIAADAEPAPTTVEQDVEQLSMSTLSFQDYVRERMLRRRQAEKQSQEMAENDAVQAQRDAERAARPAPPALSALRVRAEAGRSEPVPAAAALPPPVLRDAIAAPLPDIAPRHDPQMLDELRAMRV